MRLRIAFQGEPGAYSEAAVLAHFGANLGDSSSDRPAPTPVPCSSFELVFDRVTSGDCDFGLVPIENSLAGSIHGNYDLLLRHNLHVVGEYLLRVQHCLIARPGAVLSNIRRVISHPQALAQCDGYLHALPPPAGTDNEGVIIEAVYDTAGSVKMVSEGDDLTVAAVASRRAAELYGMSILAEGIEDNPANFTRFLAIALNTPPPQWGNPAAAVSDAKTSIVFALDNQPGSLFKALSVFALRNINLTKIESRPFVGKPWEYMFYIDFAGSTEEKTVQRALAHLEEYATTLRVLGSYPRFRL
jgi:prephenate dehydratase